MSGALRLLAELSRALATSSPDQLDDEVNRCLERVGQDSGASRAFLFRLSDDGRLMSIVNEWCAPGVEHRLSSVQAEPCDRYPWLMQCLGLVKPVLVPDRDNTSIDNQTEASVPRGLGQEAMAIAPLVARSSLLGFLGLDSGRAPQAWDEDTVSMLHVLADLLTSATKASRAGKALQESGKNLRALLENIEDFLFILDTAGRVLYFNSLVEQRLGYTVQELRLLTAVELFGLQLKAGRVPVLSELLKGDGHALILTLRSRPGGHVPVETRVTRGTWNDQSVLYAICRDISERTRAVENLRKSEARTSALLGAIPDAMLRLGRSGAILDFSPGELAQGIGGGIDGEMPRQIASGCRSAIAPALDTGQMQVVELTIPGEAEARTVEARLCAIGSDEVLAIVRDISERARLEQMKTEFINRASHELRTPLTTALLMADLIREGGEEAELNEYWDILRLELGRQHELVEDLLTVGRLEAGRLQISLSPLDITAVIDRAVATAARMAEARRLQLRVEVPADLPQVSGDASALQRVLANLLDNALKFTPAGGEVSLRVGSRDAGVFLEVADQGIGIPAEELPRLFTRFYRASNAVRAEVRGTGVGLFIVKSIVEAHAGKVTVRSEMDRGTTFEVWLPGLDPTSPASSARTDPS